MLKLSRLDPHRIELEGTAPIRGVNRILRPDGQTGGRDALVEGARTHDRPRSVLQLTEPGAIAGRPIDAGGLNAGSTLL